MSVTEPHTPLPPRRHTTHRPAARLGVNQGDHGTWPATIDAAPQFTVARCYTPGGMAAARAAGYGRFHLSMSGQEHYPDGTAAAINAAAAAAVDYLDAAGYDRETDRVKFAYVHEYNTPDKDFARFGGYGYLPAFAAVRVAVHRAYPAVRVGLVATAWGITSGQCDAIGWPGPAGLDFASFDVYSGIGRGNPATPFATAAAGPIAALRARYGASLPIDVWETNTTDAAQSPAWYAAGVAAAPGLLGAGCTVNLFQDHDDIAPADFADYLPALTAAGWHP